MRNILLLFILLVHSTVCRADLQSTVKKSVNDYILSHFLNATFVFADNKKNLMVGARGVFSSFGEQLRSDQEMPIASATKPMTAAAILRLQDQGKLNVNDTIDKYLTKDVWPDSVLPVWAQKIKIHNLLTHSSGIAEYSDKVNLNLSMKRAKINQEIMKYIVSQPLEIKIGTKYKYSNSNFILLGMIVEKVSKKNLALFLKDEFFRPLNMESTHLASLREARVVEENVYTANYPLRFFVTPNAKKPVFTQVEKGFVLVPCADKGIISSSYDLVKWYKALYSGKILSDKSYKLMTTKYFKTDTNSTSKYKTYTGYGIFIEELDDTNTMIGHSGGNKSGSYGIRSEAGYIPSIGFFFAILSNVSIVIPELKQGNSDENKLDIVYFRDSVINAVLAQEEN